MKSNFAALVTVVATALTVQASLIPREVIQVDESVVKYVSKEGVIDIASLFADTKVQPIKVPIDAAAPVQAVAPAVVQAQLVQVQQTAEDNLVNVTVPSAPTGARRRELAPVQAPTADATEETTDEPAAQPTPESTGPAGPTWNADVCPAVPRGDYGLGPTLGGDWVDFSGNQWLSAVFSNPAGAPPGYSRVYLGADGIAQGAQSSITIAIEPLNSYDVETCQSKCEYYDYCRSFSVFMLRDTFVDFTGLDTNQCNDPPALTRFMCAIYGAEITKAMVTEKGQWKGDSQFRTAIAAANGYVRAAGPTQVDGYSVTTYGGGSTSNGDTASKLVGIYNPNEDPNVVGFQPAFCATKCSGMDDCAGFNAVPVLADGVFVGTQCLLYNDSVGSEQGYNNGQWGGDGKWYSTQPSFWYGRQAE